MMKTLLFAFALAVPVFAANPIKVMLLDGESGGPYHKWKLTTPVLKKELEETGLFQAVTELGRAAVDGCKRRLCQRMIALCEQIAGAGHRPEAQDRAAVSLNHFGSRGGAKRACRRRAVAGTRR